MFESGARRSPARTASAVLLALVALGGVLAFLVIGLLDDVDSARDTLTGSDFLARLGFSFAQAGIATAIGLAIVCRIQCPSILAVLVGATPKGGTVLGEFLATDAGIVCAASMFGCISASTASALLLIGQNRPGEASLWGAAILCWYILLRIGSQSFDFFPGMSY